MENVVITQFFTNLYNAETKQAVKDVNIIKETQALQESVAKYGIELHTLINFKNSFPVPELQKIVELDSVTNNATDNIYLLRWVVTFDYLLKHPEIKKAAIVDAGDVEMMNYPFDEVDDQTLYIGDENNDLSDAIITTDSQPDYLRNFTIRNRNLELLNPGVVIASRDVLMEFLAILVKLIVEDTQNKKFAPDQAHLGEYDMALLNYVCYQMFPERLCHGRKVCTVFQHSQTFTNSWFKHK
ncbi:hypothetical protein OZX69_03635 [Lactobacillus sp. ESL0731]|uniref:hypothetical protein n=1 Tax=unclassified Lactobacillus TaxID=2620435 RepID=UPI0023F68996|nr:MULTISPECIES: hypothetical protein [unclassified Lactobacillus]WEV51801.1 hypothetical protein OZX63_03635 [Lactobacillus sp. ESL0700]WEV62930.1 hypothetical protein OZX69_03635 [Lactobacillus sp. ESL0731]